MRAIDRVNILDKMKAEELSLVPDLVIPPKFKVPDFTKYGGTSCPTKHLMMYCKKMPSQTPHDVL